MKSFLNLTALLTLAFTASTARADVDYDDLAEECQKAYEHAVELNQVVESLPADFPNRQQFVDLTSTLLQLGYSANQLQLIADGEAPEPAQSEVNEFEQALRSFRVSHVQWIKNTARQIERNSSGETEDLAKAMRRLADEIDDNFDEMIDELD